MFHILELMCNAALLKTTSFSTVGNAMQLCGLRHLNPHYPTPFSLSSHTFALAARDQVWYNRTHEDHHIRRGDGGACVPGPGCGAGIAGGGPSDRDAVYRERGRGGRGDGASGRLAVQRGPRG